MTTSEGIETALNELLKYKYPWLRLTVVNSGFQDEQQIRVSANLHFVVPINHIAMQSLGKHEALEVLWTEIEQAVFEMRKIIVDGALIR